MQIFSYITEPLTRLLSKDTKFIWDDSCENSFKQLKALLMTVPVLSEPNFTCPFKLAVDTSDSAMGAVLLQDGGNNVDHPIAKHQKNYSTIGKECLALITALQHFEAYVASSPSIIVFSDHNPLVFLHKMKNKNQRLLRWSLMLQEYNRQIQHIKGKDNVIADCLSRV